MFWTIVYEGTRRPVRPIISDTGEGEREAAYAFRTEEAARHAAEFSNRAAVEMGDPDQRAEVLPFTEIEWPSAVAVS